MIAAKFLSALVITKLPDGHWKLHEPLRYQSRRARTRFVVPAGFVTDLASVGRWPVAFWLAGDTAHEAAVIHDAMYQLRLVGTRRQADAIFNEAMTVSGVPAWRRWLMYRAVRFGGQGSWDSGPERLRILNRDSALPSVAAGGHTALRVAGLVTDLSDQWAVA